MILAIDVGNTNIVLGGIENGKTSFISRLSTDPGKTEDEYAIQIKMITELNGISTKNFSGAIISSVVPQIISTLQAAVRKVTGHTSLIVGPGLKTGLDIKIDNPAQLGSDIVVGAVAAIALYPKPLMVIDMGTATTICVVDKNKCYRGGVILPGVKVAMESLTKNAAQLQSIGLDAPVKAIGTNTADCMRSGVIFGNAAMIDSLIDRMSTELPSENDDCSKTMTIVATGGLAPKIIPFCTHNIIINDELLLIGLEIIFNLNSRH